MVGVGGREYAGVLSKGLLCWGEWEGWYKGDLVYVCVVVLVYVGMVCVGMWACVLGRERCVCVCGRSCWR